MRPNTHNFGRPYACLLLVAGLGLSGFQTVAAAASPQAKLLQERVAQQPRLEYAYRTAHYQLLWSNESNVGQLITALKGLGEDGLYPEDFHVKSLIREKKLLDKAPRSYAQAQVAFDVRATRSYLAALQDLRYGSVDPRSVYTDWELPPRHWTQQDTDAALIALRTGQVAAAFAAARPAQPQYAAMRRALVRLRAIRKHGGWPQLPGGKRMELGENSKRILALRNRLAVGGYLPAVGTASPLFDQSVQQAVSHFQHDQGLKIDGVVGYGTRAALNVPVAVRVQQLRANLERARWLLPRLGDNYVMVDIAGYRAWLVRGGKQVWSSKVQVGKADKDDDHNWNTPVLASAIDHVTINPMWTIPPNILERDVLPKLEDDPAAYLKRNHLRAYSMYSGAELDPDDVDWDDTEDYFLRQDPGPWGALGRMAIRFPNRYLVYLHQTPHTHLFEQTQRTASHGCVRVAKPYRLVELLLGWDRENLNKAIDRNEEEQVKLGQQVPIFLLYFTAWPNSDGHMGFRRDVYQRDADLLSALNARR